MSTKPTSPKNIDEYIAAFPTEVREILERIRTTIKRAAPNAEETIKYGMPTFTLGGNLVHYAAFKKHIGFFPPVKGGDQLQNEISIYAGPKGSLRFPLEASIPYALIGKIVKLRVKENLQRPKGKGKKRSTMKSEVASVEQYLAALPEDRRQALEAVRQVILKNLDTVYEEGMQYGMIGYYVPHRVYPAGYHCDPRQPLPFANLGSQKNHMALYLMCVYGDSLLAKWFREAWSKTGKKLDMGKSCLRFKKLDDLALEVIGEAIRRVPAKNYIEHCEAARAAAAKTSSKGSGQAEKSARVTAAKTSATRGATPKRKTSRGPK